MEFIVSAVTEKGLNLEEEGETGVKTGSSKIRSSSETSKVPAANLASTCSVKETQHLEDKSEEDVRGNQEECEYFGPLSSFYKEGLGLYSFISLGPKSEHASFVGIQCTW
jgi:hypothetical protein